MGTFSHPKCQLQPFVLSRRGGGLFAFYSVSVLTTKNNDPPSLSFSHTKTHVISLSQSYTHTLSLSLFLEPFSVVFLPKIQLSGFGSDFFSQKFEKQVCSETFNQKLIHRVVIIVLKGFREIRYTSSASSVSASRERTHL